MLSVYAGFTGLGVIISLMFRVLNITMFNYNYKNKCKSSVPRNFFVHFGGLRHTTTDPTAPSVATKVRQNSQTSIEI